MSSPTSASEPHTVSSASDGLGTPFREPAAIVGLYSRVAPVYELWGRLVDGRVRRRTVELMAVRDGERVVDLGAGTGSLLIELARPNPRGTTLGVDLAPGMIAAARRRVTRAGLPAVDLVQADSRQLPFDAASIDGVATLYMLDMLREAEIEATLVELRRVLRPGGRLVVASTTPAERRRDRLPERLHGSPLPFTSNCRAVRLGPLLGAHGFEVASRDYIAQWGIPSEVVLARAPGA